MPYYLLQIAFTPATFQALTQNPQDRRDAARSIIEAHGGTLHDYFFAFGAYDGILITEFPDNESVAATMMTVAASGGFARGETTVLMTMEEAVDAMRRAGEAAGEYAAPGSTPQRARAGAGAAAKSKARQPRRR